MNQRADINAKDQVDQTPLHYAAQQGHLDVVEYLVYQKADINAKDNDGKTPFDVACDHSDDGYDFFDDDYGNMDCTGFHRSNVFLYLLHQGADFGVGINGKKYFQRASEKDSLSVVEYLINQKVDVNTKDNYNEFFFVIVLFFIMLLNMVF